LEDPDLSENIVTGYENLFSSMMQRQNTKVSYGKTVTGYENLFSSMMQTKH
jgi:hypothetical protein